MFVAGRLDEAAAGQDEKIDNHSPAREYVHNPLLTISRCPNETAKTENKAAHCHLHSLCKYFEELSVPYEDSQYETQEVQGERDQSGHCTE